MILWLFPLKRHIRTVTNLQNEHRRISTVFDSDDSGSF